MTPKYEEVAHELGDGWTAIWDATDIPSEVSEAFEAAREEIRDDKEPSAAAQEATA